MTSFQALTGLKPEVAEQVSKKFNGCVAVALASFVQNRTKLSPSSFAQPTAAETNAAAINGHLTKLYADVRRIVAEGKQSESAAWDLLIAASGDVNAVLAKHATATAPPAPAATPAPNAFATAFNAAGGAQPAAAAPNPFSAAAAAKPSTAPASNPFASVASGAKPQAASGFGTAAPPAAAAAFPAAKPATPPAAGSPTTTNPFAAPAATSTPTAASNQPFGGAASPAPAKPPAVAFGAAPAAGFSTSFGAGAPAVAGPFGTAAAAAGSPPAFGFGGAAKPAAASGAPVAPAGFASGFGVLATPPAAAAAPKVAPADDVDISSVKAVPETAHKGAFIDMPHFWTAEVDGRAPLFNLDFGFLDRNRANIRERLLKWKAPVGGFYADPPVEYKRITDLDDHLVRVLIKDSVRTFFHDDHRNKFTNFLYAVATEFGNYGQSMSYLAGLCLVGLTEQETIGILRKVNKEYIPGHWATEATGFATNAWMVEDFIKERFPDVQKQFKELNFWPDTYLQKIMSGLCVHVLPFELLFDFIDHFMAEGLTWLIKFVLGVVEHFRARILKITKATEINELFEIMRLDSKACSHDDMRRVLERAKATNLGPAEALLNRIATVRSQVYDTIIGPRLAKAPKTEAFEPCEICDKVKPTWYCDECGAICDACKGGNIGPHTAQHKIERY